MTSNQITVDMVKEILKELCKKWAFQLEEGEVTKRKHYQGRMSLKIKKRQSALVTMLNDMNWKYVRLSPTSGPNRDNNFYVIKNDNTKLEGPWQNDDIVRYMPRQFREVLEMGLYPWQQAILDDVGVWNKRHINMIYDEKGCIGKSSIVGILRCRGLARMVPPMNDYKDVMRFVMSFPPSKMYLVDMPRAINQTKVEGLIAGLEELKGGHMWDDRYHAKEDDIDSPNIWVFANRLPEFHMLSPDRWRVFQIVDNQLVRYTNTGGWSAPPPPLAAGANISINLNTN